MRRTSISVGRPKRKTAASKSNRVTWSSEDGEENALERIDSSSLLRLAVLRARDGDASRSEADGDKWSASSKVNNKSTSTVPRQQRRETSTSDDLSKVVLDASVSRRKLIVKERMSSSTLAQLRLAELDLHGREEEMALLKDKLLNISSDNDAGRELILVAGVSGVGKVRYMAFVFPLLFGILFLQNLCI
jgi:hypothetical protein